MFDYNVILARAALKSNENTGITFDKEQVKLLYGQNDKSEDNIFAK